MYSASNMPESMKVLQDACIAASKRLRIATKAVDAIVPGTPDDVRRTLLQEKTDALHAEMQAMQQMESAARALPKGPKVRNYG